MAPAVLAADVLAELARDQPAEVAKIVRTATLEARAVELLERQRETAKDVEALAALVNEVCSADGS